MVPPEHTCQVLPIVAKFYIIAIILAIIFHYVCIAPGIKTKVNTVILVDNPIGFSINVLKTIS